MKNKTCVDITSEEIDILMEAGNIASGNAMTSLGKLIKSTLDMNVVKVKIEEIYHLPEALGNEEEVIAGMIINIYGDIKGMLLLALEPQSASEIVSTMLEKPKKDLQEIDELGKSVLCEIGNILGGSYLSALNTFTGLKIEISIPSMCIDMAGAILSYPAIELIMNDDEMLFVETVFRDTNNLLSGTYILILDNSSYSRVIDVMGKGL